MTITTEPPAADTLPGKTEHETHEYRRDRGHRIAAAQAYRYIARLIETSDDYPLPAGSEAVIAHAAAAMRDVHATRTADAEAYAAGRLAAIYGDLAAYRAEIDAMQTGSAA